MNQSFFVAKTGLIQQQNRVDVVANNLANVNTVGYKANRVNFRDAMYSAGFHPSDPATPGGNLQRGNGVSIASITRDMNQGSVIQTGNSNDLCLNGGNYFEIRNSDGEISYTRQGTLYLGRTGDDFALLNSDGSFFLDDAGNAITVPDNTGSFTVTPDGVISFEMADGEVYEAKLGVYTFPNPEGLTSAGDSYYKVSPSSGGKIAGEDVELYQGALEGSNVDMAREFTYLIRAQRALSLSSKALQTSDQMEGIANSMKN